jgi:flap endonuclease-1
MDRKGRITSHLSGLFYRNMKLLEHDISLIYVFDGEPPVFKAKTLEARKEIKEEAEKKLKEAIEKGKVEERKTYAQATARISDEIVEQSKRLLDAMGINIVQAPSEGEAQAAYLASAGYAYAVCSQDYDSLLFGSPRLIRNLTITGRRKLPRKDIYIEVEPELIELSQIEEKNIDRKKLIWIGILVGTDYNEGVKGIGPKKALEIVKKAKSLKEAFQLANGEYSDLIEEIENFFLNPPIEKDITIEKKEMDEEKIMKILCDEFDFSEERVRNALAEYQKSQKKKGQSKLEDWF